MKRTGGLRPVPYRADFRPMADQMIKEHYAKSEEKHL